PVEPAQPQTTPESVAEQPAPDAEAPSGQRAVEPPAPEPAAPIAPEQPVAAEATPDPAPEQVAAAEAAPDPAPEQVAAETTPELTAEEPADAPAPEQVAAAETTPELMAEQPADAPAPEVAEAAPAESVPAGEQAPAPSGDGDAKPKRKRSRSRKPKREGDRRPTRQPRQPRRQAGPLPISELRAAAQSIMEQQGSRRAVRDAFSVLADRERKEISQLVSDDGEWRIRARNISAGSLGAGRVGTALAAQQVSMASPEDIWPVTLSKEEAADRQSRVRSARQRDERRAQRDADRENRADRVSRADLAKAQDGRVGAQIRFVIEEPKGKRKKDKPEGTEEPEQRRGSSVLDRLGY
ncbi:MAG: hypothetical protein JWO74_1629, partial [Solirubrobacterales bacterium]|nr:hypothetical protein [Solirubrobacterales bacterium]